MTARLSEEHLADLEERGYSMKRAGYSRSVAVKQAELHELIRGYRRAAALEDMLEDWLASANLYSDIPLMERTEALLAEGDE